MEEVNVYIFFSIMIPLIMMLTVFMGKSRTLLLFIIIGGVMCVLAGEINALIMQKENISFSYLTQNISPIVEEILKATPIFIFAALFKPQTQLLIEVAISVGIGFALMENTSMLFGMMDDITLYIAVIRGFGAGMMHGLCTFLVGIGVYVVRIFPRIKITETLAILACVSIYHSMYNTIIESKYEIFGIILPILTFVPAMVVWKKEKQHIDDYGNSLKGKE